MIQPVSYCNTYLQLSTFVEGENQDVYISLHDPPDGDGVIEDLRGLESRADESVAAGDTIAKLSLSETHKSAYLTLFNNSVKVEFVLNS